MVRNRIATSKREVWASKDELLRAAGDRAVDDPVTIKIRDLLTLFGARARGAVIVNTIRNELRQAGLDPDPDFATGHIDNSVRLAPAENGVQVVEEAGEVSLKVNSLRAASLGALTVTPDDPISRAQTLMALNNYSQLIVAQSPRTILGAISWESIGRVAMIAELNSVRQATVRVEEVHQDDDLLPLLPQIASLGYVVVRAKDNQLSGIITAADVTEEFDALASPFFLLGEIERRLRLVVSRVFTTDEIIASAAHDGDGGRPINGIDDMSLGQIARLLESADSWARLGWRADQVEFTKALDDVRSVRNRLMHFSPDLPTAEEVLQMRNLLTLLKAASRTRAS